MRKFTENINHQSRVYIIRTQEGDWEALYIDGEIKDEGHHLGEGDRLFLLKMSEKYNFKSSDITECSLDDVDEKATQNSGNLPKYLKDLKGSY